MDVIADEADEDNYESNMAGAQGGAAGGQGFDKAYKNLVQ